MNSNITPGITPGSTLYTQYATNAKGSQVKGKSYTQRVGALSQSPEHVSHQFEVQKAASMGDFAAFVALHQNFTDGKNSQYSLPMADLQANSHIPSTLTNSARLN